MAFPDPTWSEFRQRAIPQNIRWSIAGLIVGTPVFLYTARANTKALLDFPALRTSSVRRWLTYLTLAIAAGVLLGDSTSLLYRLLGGELTTRFVLKAITLGAIAGTIFYYYLTDLRRDEEGT